MLFLMLLRVCWSPVLLLRFSFFFSPAPAVHPCPVYLFLLLLYFCCSYILLLSSYCFFCFFCFSCSCVAAVLVVLLLRYCCLSCPASALLLFLLSFSCVTAVPPVLFLRYCCSSCPVHALLLFLLSCFYVTTVSPEFQWSIQYSGIYFQYRDYLRVRINEACNLMVSLYLSI